MNHTTPLSVTMTVVEWAAVSNAAMAMASYVAAQEALDISDGASMIELLDCVNSCTREAIKYADIARRDRTVYDSDGDLVDHPQLMLAHLADVIRLACAPD